MMPQISAISADTSPVIPDLSLTVSAYCVTAKMISPAEREFALHAYEDAYEKRNAEP